jgi:hypothetical protein
MSLTLKALGKFFFTARSPDRAVLLWGLWLVSAATLALTEGNQVALWASAIGISLLPSKVSIERRATLIVIALLALVIGSEAILVGVSVALLLAGVLRGAQVAFISMSCAQLLYPHFQSVPELALLRFNAGSSAFLVIPALTATITFGVYLRKVWTLALIASVLVATLLIAAGSGTWISQDVLTSSTFRVAMALATSTYAVFLLQSAVPEAHERIRGFAAVGFLVGAFATLMLTPTPIDGVYFDESHGKWATVDATYGPADFGRSSNYTYSLLAQYSKQLTGKTSAWTDEQNPLPNRKAVFVIKMPTEPISAEFSQRLSSWVHAGGRLLIFADHTDLYDTAQNLNTLLTNHFGLRIKSDAVFDRYGMPNLPNVSASFAIFGRIDARDFVTPWQTGTSLALLPLNAVQLASYGPSYSEPGDYSRPNRFGRFIPNTSLRFLSHTSAAGLSVGQGAVVIVLDSTPWSNFSIFKSQYQEFFRGVLWALSNPKALWLWGWSALILGGLVIGLGFSRSATLLATASVTLGVAIGSASQIGAISWEPQLQDRDFRLRVLVGEHAKLEFLKQLVGPGERNFSRIVASMAKYDLRPSALPVGASLPDLSSAKHWLILHPDDHQLPLPDRVIDYLRDGNDLTIVFAPEQARKAEIRRWLRSLGLQVFETTALANAEDAKAGTLLGRRGPAILRDVRVVTGALPTSLLKEDQADRLFQTYTVRPTTLPRISGQLNLSFSADQFSDAAIGDVWEGIEPTAIGKLREQQMAAVLTRQELPMPFPTSLHVPSGSFSVQTLPVYVLLEDGRPVLNGKFDQEKLNERYGYPPSPNDNPVAYLLDLQRRALAFITAKCPAKGSVTRCDEHMLGPDMLEWSISWLANEEGKAAAVELLHERSFSSLGLTLNVVFSE